MKTVTPAVVEIMIAMGESLLKDREERRLQEWENMTQMEKTTFAHGTRVMEEAIIRLKWMHKDMKRSA